jgi:hypothetical protein
MVNLILQGMLLYQMVSEIFLRGNSIILETRPIIQQTKGPRRRSWVPDDSSSGQPEPLIFTALTTMRYVMRSKARRWR